MSRRARSPARRRVRSSERDRRAAFTLLEIMVALIVGVITITVAYTLSNGTTKVLSEQHRVAQTQTAVRLAMEQIRADIERAGLFGTPNSAAERTCVSIPGQFQAVAFTNSQYVDAIPHAGAHLVDGDGLILTGNYITSGNYLLTGLATSTGDTVEFQSSWQSFRRDFGDPISEAAFDRAFPTGRWLHITTLQGMHFFTQVTSARSAGFQLDIDPAMAPGGLCTVGLADGATISPINAIEYAILNPYDDDELAALVGLRADESEAERNLIEGIPSVLVRREVNPFTGAAVPGTTRVVLEYVVEFDLAFDIDITSGPTVAPTLNRVAGDVAQGVLGPTGTAPQQVRAVEVRLSARTPEAERTMPWIQRTAGAPLTRYYARPVAPVAARRLPSSRVRTLTTTVFLPNVAASDLP